MKKPIISIVLPTYNGAKYLAQSIQSVICQTMKDWELIIVNDCSTDNTLEIAQKFSEKDKRIIVISNKINKKLPCSLNIGFAQARGQYFTWTSDDNLYKPNALAKMVEYLDENPKTDLVSFAEDIIDKNGIVIGNRVEQNYPNGKRDIYQFIFGNNIGAAFMYRKIIADKIGGYDMNTFGAEDYDYWYRIAIVGKVDFVDDINIYQYRKHQDSLTATMQSQILEKRNIIIAKYAPEMFEKLKFSDRDVLIAKLRLKLPSMPVSMCDRIWFWSRNKLAKYVAMPIFWNKKLRRNVRRALEPQLSFEKECTVPSFFKKRKNLAVWGWWQGKNLGDNWIKDSVHKIFPNAEFIDTSVMDFSDYKFVIIGGGGLFFDDAIPPFNKKIKTHFGAFGLGAEFPNISNRTLELSKSADFFFVRDQYSLDCMGIKNIVASVDITFSNPISWVENEKAINMEKLFWVYRGGEDFLSYPNNPKLKKFIEYGRYKNNKDIFEKIISEKFKEIIADDFQTTDDDVAEHIGDCGFVITGRFHGVIMAIQRGLPVVAIDICPKIRVLMIDVGIDEYLIKMDEIEKLPELIVRAKNNISQIRAQELQYRTNAIKIIKKDIAMAKLIVAKQTGNAMRGIHYGAYWMGQNDIINVMSDDLADLCDLTKIDLKLYAKKCDHRVKSKEKMPNGQVTILDTKLLLKDLKKFRPDFILLNSAGLTLEDEGFAYCKSQGIKVVGTAMSDPDVYPHNGKLFAHKFDLFYTNSKLSLETKYDNTKVNIKLMPFAASAKHHYYMPDVPKKYDIVIVGHARPDRLKVVEKLKDFKLGLFGNGWGDAGLGSVHGIDHVRAINSGKIYLSFALTNEGYQNIKVGLFEAMATNTCVVVAHMDELSDYFEIGQEVLCYKNTDELIEILKKYIVDDDAREAIRKKGFKRFLRDHTYHRRFVKMLGDITKL